jgi:hypothetical protein
MGQSPSVPEVADSATEDVRLCEGLLNSLNKKGGERDEVLPKS